MKNHFIHAIIFDNNGTLRRTTRRTDTERASLIVPILERVGSNLPVDEFSALIASRLGAYRIWSAQTLRNVSEEDLWSIWLLPEFSAELIRPLAKELNRVWRKASGVPIMIADAHTVITTLFQRGYRLGIASNTLSSTDIPDMLQEQGIAGCFDAVVLSGVFGKRKPDPSLLQEAARQLNVPTCECVYIGNRYEMDVVAARKAGFAKVILLRDPVNPHPLPEDPALIPDHTIDTLSDLLEIFPLIDSPRDPILS